MPRQFLETCAKGSRRDNETRRALVSSLGIEVATDTLQACEKPKKTLLPSIPPLPPAWSFFFLTHMQHKVLLLSISGTGEVLVRSYYLNPRLRKFLWCASYKGAVLLCLLCSMHKVPCWIIFTGQSGTTMSPWQRTAPTHTSTMRTCCWVSHAWDNWRWRTTPVWSMMTSRRKSQAAMMYTLKTRRKGSPLGSSMEQRKCI